MTRPDTARLPVARDARAADPKATCEAGFAAQLLADGGARRGLRGGAPVLRGARAAYLSTQWRGEDDRRPAAGLLRKVVA